MNRWLAVMLVVGCCALFVAPACKKKSASASNPDQAAILAQYERRENAIKTLSVQDYLNCHTYEYTERQSFVRDSALYASKKETLELEPSMLRIVLALRNRSDRRTVERMTTPGDVVVWLIREGIISSNEERDFRPYEITVLGDVAEMQMGVLVEDEPSGGFGRRGRARAVGSMLASATGQNEHLEPIPDFILHFRKLNGYWYVDSIASFQQVDQLLKERARAQVDMAPWELIRDREEEDAGGFKESAWEPLIPLGEREDEAGEQGGDEAVSEEE